MRLRILVGVGVSVLVLAQACSEDDVQVGDGADPGATGSGAQGTGNAGGAGIGGAGGSGALAGGTGPGSGGSGPCSPGNSQCTDCIDNDNDGHIDAWDVECVGPLDDDEGSFATGIPGDNSDACKQDCFFDGDSGSGNDGCLWDLACDPESPGAPECPYDPDKMNCPEITQKCLDNCGGYTPNGCDCFGCCEITLPDMSSVTIKLTPDCTEETLQDPTVCKPCTQVVDCLNDCEPCEYCLGKTELPPECDNGTGGGGGAGGGGGGDCVPGPACDPDTPCPIDLYCLTGCCVDIPS
jgi:hypothetical protein